MRGKREAGNREEAGLPQGTEKEELRVTGSPIGSGMTAEVVSGMTPYKKAGMTPASPSFPCSDTGIHKKGSPKSDSESGRSSISSFPRRRKSGKGDESGRSMVETLGVLAIMGLLAIGGIIGYRYAVDKYNANEIINEVKKRAIVASQQRIQNQQIDLKEFHPTTDRDLIQNRYLVSVSNEYNNNLDFFSISLDSIPENVCNALLNMDWTLPVEIKIGDVIVTDNTTCPTETDTSILFAFHNLLNPDAVPTDPACENITCPVGTTCLKGKCLCPDGYEQCAGRCCQDGTICSTNGSDGTCIQADGCTRNEDCKDNDGNRDTGKYCNITTTYNEAEPSCYENYIGRCVNKGSLPSPINIPGLGATWRGGYMTWWSAKNWCLSHGKRLIELDDFECARLSGEHLGYCCNSDHPVCTADKSTLSIIMHHFSEAYSGGPTCWTGTDYGSCFVYDFAVDGRFAHGRRSYNGSVPLCVNP